MTSLSRFAVVSALVAGAFVSFNARAESPKQACAGAGHFLVGSKTAVNQGLQDAFGNRLTDESQKAAQAIEAAFGESSCVYILIDEPSAKVASMIVLAQKRKAHSVSYQIQITEGGYDATRSGCADITAVPPATRAMCFKELGTEFVADTRYHDEPTYGPIEALKSAGPGVKRIFATQNSDARSGALKAFGLDVLVAKVRQSLVVMGGAAEAELLVLSGNGYAPDLFAPNFWSKSWSPDAKAEKILGTILFLNSIGKAYVDPNLGGSKLVDLKGYTPPKFGTKMGYDLERELMRAMENAGYKYAPTWVK